MLGTVGLSYSCCQRAEASGTELCKPTVAPGWKWLKMSLAEAAGGDVTYFQVPRFAQGTISPTLVAAVHPGEWEGCRVATTWLLFFHRENLTY